MSNRDDGRMKKECKYCKDKNVIPYTEYTTIYPGTINSPIAYYCRECYALGEYFQDFDGEQRKVWHEDFFELYVLLETNEIELEKFREIKHKIYSDHIKENLKKKIEYDKKTHNMCGVIKQKLFEKYK